MNNSLITKQMWDDISKNYLAKSYTDEKLKQVKQYPEKVFHPVFYEMLSEKIKFTAETKICVIGSGDSFAVFALALLGASVTAVDISSEQLKGAKTAAKKLNVADKVNFICDDAMTLSKIDDEEFDMVITTNGTLAYISDLNSMATQIYRVLKPNGKYLLYDVHPFMRPFAGYVDKLKIKKPYEAIGPFTRAYVFHWRVQDIVEAIVDGGLGILELKEYHAETGTFWTDFVNTDKLSFDSLYDWNRNPLAALPQWIAISSSK